MPNIIRIRNLDNETDIENIIIPVDKGSYTSTAKQINVIDLKNWILSGFTGGTGGSGGTSGTSGINGLDGTSGISPCLTLQSNYIIISIMSGTTTTTTSTTTLAPTTTTTTLAPTTTTTTLAPTTTTTTLAPTTTTTTLAPTTTTTTTAPTTTTTTTPQTIFSVGIARPADPPYISANLCGKLMSESTYISGGTLHTVYYSGATYPPSGSTQLYNELSLTTFFVPGGYYTDWAMTNDLTHYGAIFVMYDVTILSNGIYLTGTDCPTPTTTTTTTVVTTTTTTVAHTTWTVTPDAYTLSATACGTSLSTTRYASASATETTVTVFYTDINLTITWVAPTAPGYIAFRKSGATYYSSQSIGGNLGIKTPC